MATKHRRKHFARSTRQGRVAANTAKLSSSERELLAIPKSGLGDRKAPGTNCESGSSHLHRWVLHICRCQCSNGGRKPAFILSAGLRAATVSSLNQSSISRNA
jgi:hypothetical protein